MEGSGRPAGSKMVVDGHWGEEEERCEHGLEKGNPVKEDEDAPPF